MTQIPIVDNVAASAPNPTDWLAKIDALAYAYGRPVHTGLVKQRPEDFRVTELMNVVPSGAGEHIWLNITKVRKNTDQVARALARFANVAYRDVGYAGMKDVNAVTTQWFSVWRPKGPDLDWEKFELPGVKLNQVSQHSRKIKRGTHSANRFAIIVRELKGDSLATELDDRLKKIQQQGVPNYFGRQRFGRNSSNMSQVEHMFATGKRPKNRSLQSMLLSSARSWLFNSVVSARVAAGTWQQLLDGEPANLNGSNSLFQAQNTVDESARLASLDIHPTAPLFGDGVAKVMSGCDKLHAWELGIMREWPHLMAGLVAARLDYQRRSLRTAVTDLRWAIDGSDLTIDFELLSGQFATSVLRELVIDAECVR